MKRCPKCGTVLEDDKKRCYMCGADLLRSAITQFGDSFDAQVGATVSNSQDNIFNNVQNISADLSEAVSNKSEGDSTFTNSGADFYNNNGLDGLNSMQFDNRTTIEKIFSGNQRFRSKDEINADLEVRKNVDMPLNDNKPIDNVIDRAIHGDFTENNDKTFHNDENFMNSNVDNNGILDGYTGITVDKAQLNNNTSNVSSVNDIPFAGEVDKNTNINWGDNLARNNKVSFLNKIKGIKLDVGFIVNTLCFIVFLVIVLIIYNKFIKPTTNGELSFGGLRYQIDEKFVLKTEETSSRYYTYGNDCAIQIKFGTTNDSNNFVNNYFESVKDMYSEEEGYITQTNDLTLSGNKWHELSVLKVQQIDTTIGNTKTMVMYRYVSMVYNNNYYQIVYANTDNNNECSAMYDKLINSMEFE